MKTAVEWLIEAMYQETYPFNPKYSKIFEQAKEMERKQIIEAFKQGVAYWNGDEWKLIDIEQYYNETFKSE
jgi:hypothetical protein